MRGGLGGEGTEMPVRSLGAPSSAGLERKGGRGGGRGGFDELGPLGAASARALLGAAFPEAGEGGAELGVGGGGLTL